MTNFADNPTIQEAANRLQKIFPSDQDQIKFLDDRGDGRHFTLQITSDAFTNRSQIERQRMIYDQLDDLIKKDAIHALRMELKTHNEATNPDLTTAQPTSQSQNSDQDHPLHTLTNQHPVMVFMKGDRFLPMCGFSAQIIELLDELEAEYETFDILTDEDVRQGLKEYSNWPTYPQLYINGQLIGGIDITRDLHEKGELEKILNQAKSDARP